MVKKLLISSLLLLTFTAVSFGQGLIKQEYFENGKLSTSVFKDGDSYRYIRFYESGKIMERGKFTEGKRDGKFERWYEDGSPQVVVSFTKNNKDGNWTIWNEEGQMILEARFQKGKLLKGSMWDEGGNLIAAR